MCAYVPALVAPAELLNVVLLSGNWPVSAAGGPDRRLRRTTRRAAFGIALQQAGGEHVSEDEPNEKGDHHYFRRHVH
ncbi:MAG TPA: hypothetical protein VH352_15720 [Pseudonocardiaceae bacterium]|nr:hypothetical protein [Pseudonocardiaceae bacterium]